jgi:hypothetical protein
VQDPGNAVAVDRSGPAERKEREGPRVLAVLYGVDAGGVRHALVDKLVNAPRGLGHAEFERPCDSISECPLGGHAVQVHAAPEEEIRVQVAEDQVGVGDGWLGPAEPVAGWPRAGARAVWPNFQKAHGVEARDRAATGADLDQLDDGHLDGQAATLLEAVLAVHLEFGRRQRLAVLDHAELGSRSTHVEGEQVLDVGKLAVVGGGQRARGRPGLEQADRETNGCLNRGNSARRKHEK